jgi:hypothetical protein
MFHHLHIILIHHLYKPKLYPMYYVLLFLMYDLDMDVPMVKPTIKLKYSTTICTHCILDILLCLTTVITRSPDNAPRIVGL